MELENVKMNDRENKKNMTKRWREIDIVKKDVKNKAVSLTWSADYVASANIF
jgi:hypothetical protein